MLGSTLLCHQFDGIGLVFLNAHKALGHFGSLHEQFHTHQHLVRLFKHQAMVCGQVWLTLHSIDDDPFGLELWRRHELHMSWEASTTHTDDTSILHFFDNDFGRQFWLVSQGDEPVTTVDGRFPLVTFHGDIDSRLLVATGIHHGVHLQHSTTDRREDGSGQCLLHRLANLRTHLDLVTFLHTWKSRSADVLSHGEHSHFWQLCHFDWFSGRQLILCRMNTTYSKCLHNLIYYLSIYYLLFIF